MTKDIQEAGEEQKKRGRPKSGGSSAVVHVRMNDELIEMLDRLVERADKVDGLELDRSQVIRKAVKMLYRSEIGEDGGK